MKLSRRKKARRSTIAPAGFEEKSDYIVMGDKYIQVLTFFRYPNEFGDALLASMVTSPNYNIDIKVSHSNLDEASALKSEMNEIRDKYEHSRDDVERQKLLNKYRSLESYSKILVGSSHSTLDVKVQLYVKADSKEELKRMVKDIKTEFSAGSTAITLRNIKYIQEDLYKENSPLFIKNKLSTEVAYTNGRIMSSLSFAGLWPWIFDTLEDPEGTLIGRELTNGGKIIFNQFLYKDYPDIAKISGRPNGNIIVVGRTGTGKTTVMNLLLMGHIINHRKIIWIDPENKNENLCRFINGNYVCIGVDGNIINVFDLKPISTDSDSRESKEIMYNTRNAIFNVIEEIKIMFEILFPNISEEALAMIGEITVETYKSVGIDGNKSFEFFNPEDYPTFTNFSTVILEMKDRYLKEPKVYEQELKALKELEIKMRQITGYGDIPGEWGRYFNGITTIKKDTLEQTGMIAIGTKHLFNVQTRLKNALLRQIFQFTYSLCLDSREECVFCVDEEHMFIGEEKLAELLGIIQRRVRKYDTVTISGTQEVYDFASPKILTHGKAIFDNACYQFYMNITKDGVTDLSKLVTLTEEEKYRLEVLSPHTGILFCGQKRIPIEVLATEDELNLIA